MVAEEKLLLLLLLLAVVQRCGAFSVPTAFGPMAQEVGSAFIVFFFGVKNWVLG